MANNEKVEYTLSLRDAFSGKMNDANESVDRFNKDAKEGTKRSEGFSEGLKNIAAAGAAIAGSLGIREVVQDLRRMGQVQTDVQGATGKTGDALRGVSSEVSQLAAATEENAGSIVGAANAVAKNLGISFEEALTKIEQGFKRGANQNNDFLEQLKEYPSALKTMNISADEFIGIITQAGNEGVFSDKGLDTIKEFQNSLGEVREEGSEVRKALTSLRGIDPDKVADLFDAGEGMKAIQRISKAITDLDSQTDRQSLITKIFKGVGEDAGENFFKMMAGGTKTLDQFDSTLSPLEDSFFGLDQAIVRVKSSITSAFAPVLNMAVDLFQRFEPQILAVVKALLLVGGAGGAIFAVVRGINMLSIAFAANPIGAIITAVAALAAGMVYLFQTNDAVNKTITGLWVSLKELLMPALTSLWKTIKKALVPLWEQLKGIFEDLKPLFVFVAKIIGGALFLAIKNIQVTFAAWMGVLNIIVGIFSDLIDGVQALFKWFLKVTGLGDLFDDLKEKFEGIFDFSAIIESVTSGLSFLGDKLAEFLEGVGMENTAEGIRSAISGITSVFDPGTDEDTEDEGSESKKKKSSVGQSIPGMNETAGAGATLISDGGSGIVDAINSQTFGAKQIIDAIKAEDFGNEKQIIETVNSKDFEGADEIVKAIKNQGFKNEDEIVDAINAQKPGKVEAMDFKELGGSITGTESATSESRSISGSVSGSSSGGRKVTINISNLVETLNITAADLGESADRIRDEITRALTAAVTDSSIVNTN